MIMRERIVIVPFTFYTEFNVALEWIVDEEGYPEIDDDLGEVIAEVDALLAIMKKTADVNMVLDAEDGQCAMFVNGYIDETLIDAFCDEVGELAEFAASPFYAQVLTDEGPEMLTFGENSSDYDSLLQFMDIHQAKMVVDLIGAIPGKADLFSEAGDALAKILRSKEYRPFNHQYTIASFVESKTVGAH